MQSKILVAIGTATFLGLSSAPAFAASSDHDAEHNDTTHVIVAVAWESSDEAQQVNSDQLTARAQSLGLTVRPAADGETLDISGPSSLINRTFGIQRVAGAATSSPLGPEASGVLDPADQTPVFQPRGLSGATLGGIYGATNQRVGVAPDPSLSAITPIVATVQFSTWDPASLTAYASTGSIFADRSYDPVASGQWSNRPVTANNCQSGLNDAGEDEVLLDQEAILGVAPTLRQRTYTAANTGTCILNAYAAVLADVQAGWPIVTLSTSWGGCEAALTANGRSSGFIQSVDNVLQQIAAAGVTISAAAGDDGANDCRRSPSSGQPFSSTGSDFPASSTAVIAVGGTTHTSGAAKPSTSSPDLAWNSAADSATGGGQSGAGLTGTAFTGWARPSWQTSAQGFPGVTKRLLPDIAVAADPTNGLNVVGAGDICGPSGGPCGATIGGTSLGAPLFAGLLGQLAVDRSPAGSLTRFGLIAPTLYAHPEIFTDVVAAAGSGSLYTWPVGPGFDQASGLGTPDVSVLAQVMSAAPVFTTVVVPVASPKPEVALPSARPISLGKAVGVTTKYFSKIRTPKGIALSSSHKGATITIHFNGRGLELFFATARNSGRVRITIDGRSQTFDLYSAKSVSRLKKFLLRSSGDHTAIITVLGSHSKQSTGNRVVLTFLRVRA